MPYPDDPLDSVQDRVAIPDLEALDFSSTDPATTLAKVRLLTEAATYFNTIAVAEFGGRLGPLRAPGMLEGVIGAAFQTFGALIPTRKHSTRRQCSCGASPKGIRSTMGTSGPGS